MRDLSAKNFGIAGIFRILLLLATLKLFGFLTYLAWNQENPWPSSKHQHSGHIFTLPAPKAPKVGPAILLGQPPIPQSNRQIHKL